MAMKEIKITDFEGLQIGNAENTEAATGCTVLLFGKRWRARRAGCARRGTSLPRK